MHMKQTEYSIASENKFLVTTADESTWNTEKTLLFLGEWCRIFSKHEKLEKFSISQHPYHWSDRSKYASDYRILTNLYESKLADLSKSLGDLHGTTQDIRYWRIILGPWLRFFIDAVFDRFEQIRTVTETETIGDTWIHDYKVENWIPIDFQEFYDQFRYDAWNHIIFSECIKASKLSYTQRKTELTPERSMLTKPGWLKGIARKLLDIYSVWLPERFNRVVLVAAYIPSDKLRKLQKSLGQLPYIRSPYIRIDERNTDNNMRKSISLNNSDTAFEKVLNKLIIDFIPFAYVENFSKLKAKSLSAFPRRPQIIFTANAYQADDGFKVWAANYVVQGVPLVIEQHGGHFGIGLLNQTEDHQIQIADVFASWGWSSRKFTNVKPLPAMKLVDEPEGFDPQGEILLTTASYPRYFYCHFSVTVAGQFPEYLQELIRFSKLLYPGFTSLLKIRTDADIFGWEIHNRLKAADLGGYIDNATAGLMTRLKNCRICVSTYNATVFLETLAANFPTLVFFDPGKYEIRPEAIPAMDSLRKVGILHDTPESAAEFLNLIGSDVAGWWYGQTLQKVRAEFCQSYAVSSKNWIQVWTQFFQSMLDSKNVN